MTNPQNATRLSNMLAAPNYPTFVIASWMQPTYNDTRSRIIAALGLIGEAGEVAEIIKKRVRGDTGEHVSTIKLLQEAGDFWYYLNLILLQLGYPGPTEKFWRHHKPVAKTYTQAEAMVRLMSHAAKLSRRLIRFAEVPIKDLGANTIPTELISGIVDSLVCLIEQDGALLINLERLNREKLTSRLQQNGSLRGSGDR